MGEKKDKMMRFTNKDLKNMIVPLFLEQLPDKLVGMADTLAVRLLQRAYEGGITFFDTARAYSDSEEKTAYFIRSCKCLK